MNGESIPALRVVVIYLVVAALWVAGSDWVLGRMIADPVLLSLAQTGKGWLFVAVTAALLYGLIAREVARMHRVGAAARVAAGEREAAVQALSASRRDTARQLAQLEAIYAHAPAGLVFVDTDLRYVRVNRYIAQLDGVPVAAHVGRRVAEISPVAAQAEELYRRVLESGEPLLDVEVREEGDGRTFLASYVPVFDGDRSLLGVSGVVQDISERKRAETALRESERRFRVLFEDSPLFLCEEDWSAARVELAELAAQAGDAGIEGWLQGHPEAVTAVLERVRVVAGNRVAGHLFGRGEEHFEVGPNQLFAGSARATAAQLLARLAAGETRFAEESMVLDHSGAARPVMLYFHAIPGYEESLGRVLVSMVDLSERKRIEEQLVENTRELRRTAMRMERSNRELQQFSYVVAHDLKAPLRAVSNLSTWIQEDAEGRLSEDGARMLRLLGQRVRRMDALIDGLLEYSRVGMRPACYEAIDTVMLFREIVSRQRLPEGFNVTIAPELPTLIGDRKHLHTLFGNLLENAVQHNDRGAGNVWVESADGGDHWVISVRDDGPGIALPYHGKVFEMFQTLAPSEDTEQTGIGLALVRKLADLQGGCVQLESEPGKGAVFRVLLPKEPTPQ